MKQLVALLVAAAFASYAMAEVQTEPGAVC